MLAIIGGEPRRSTPFADLYRRALAEMGKAHEKMMRSIALYGREVIPLVREMLG
jgi:hypothetical protein